MEGSTSCIFKGTITLGSSEIRMDPTRYLHSEHHKRSVSEYFVHESDLLFDLTVSPCVPVLVSDLLLHLSICEGLQQGAPLVCITRVADGNLYCGERVLTAGKLQH